VGASLGVLAPALIACCACSPAPPKNVSLHDYLNGVLDKIADECGLLRSAFDLRGDDELHFKPDPDARYESVDCGLQKINASKIPFRLGFVGNEAYQENLH